jgi:hypothetical protein
VHFEVLGDWLGHQERVLTGHLYHLKEYQGIHQGVHLERPCPSPWERFSKILIRRAVTLLACVQESCIAVELLAYELLVHFSKSSIVAGVCVVSVNLRHNEGKSKEELSIM